MSKKNLIVWSLDQNSNNFTFASALAVKFNGQKGPVHDATSRKFYKAYIIFKVGDSILKIESNRVVQSILLLIDCFLDLDLYRKLLR